MIDSEQIKKITYQLSNYKLIPFIGSGFSKPLNLPTWQELINGMKSKLITSSNNHLEIAQEYKDYYGRDDLINFIRKRIEITNIPDGALANQQLILSLLPPLIYTTNYDNALELASSELNYLYK